MNQPKMNLEDTKELACACGHKRFKQAITMREISALYTNTGKNEVHPLFIIVCEKCDTVYEKPSIIS
tara:strand:+ start:28 stop:228 length:201 start_codon:yes stop_codon:yes gene_type:complete